MVITPIAGKNQQKLNTLIRLDSVSGLWPTFVDHWVLVNMVCKDRFMVKYDIGQRER